MEKPSCSGDLLSFPKMALELGISSAALLDAGMMGDLALNPLRPVSLVHPATHIVPRLSESCWSVYSRVARWDTGSPCALPQAARAAAVMRLDFSKSGFFGMRLTYL